MAERAIIYARVSTDEQRGNYSISSQLHECLNYIQNKGYTLVGDRFVDSETGMDSNTGIPAYVDDYSSLELNRPSLDAAYDFLDRQGFEVVVVNSIDRLDRDPGKLNLHEYGFHRGGARVEFVIGDYDNTPQGKFMKTVIAGAAQFENDWRTEKFKLNKRQKARRGLFVQGSAPYGYRIDREAFGGLAVIPEQAEAVNYIFDLYVNQGYSIGMLNAHLNEIGKYFPAKGGSWANSSLVKILRNPAYIGKAYYNKTDCNGKERNVKDRDEWIEIEIEPILDESLFEVAQERISHNRQVRRRQPKRTYLLAGMVSCERCQKAYTGYTKQPRRNNRKKRYIGYRHRIKTGHCVNKIVNGQLLEGIVWDKIVEILLDPSVLEKGYHQALEQEQASQKRQRDYLEELYRTLDRLEIRRQNLITAYTDPEIGLNRDEFLTQRDKVNDEISRTKDNIEMIKSQLDEIPTAEEFAQLEKFSAEVRKRFLSDEWNPSLENKRKVLEMLKIRVILSVEDDKGITGRITGWMGDVSGFRLYDGHSGQASSVVHFHFYNDAFKADDSAGIDTG